MYTKLIILVHWPLSPAHQQKGPGHSKVRFPSPLCRKTAMTTGTGRKDTGQSGKHPMDFPKQQWNDPGTPPSICAG